jgi:hypothetical protein
LAGDQFGRLRCLGRLRRSGNHGGSSI